MTLGGHEQVVHRHPAAGLEGQPDLMRGMPQVLRQVLADPDQPLVHESRLLSLEGDRIFASSWTGAFRLA